MDDRQPTSQQGDGITGPQARSTSIARYRKAIAAGAVGAGLSLLLVSGVFAAPPATPGTGTPAASPAASSQPANGTPGTGGPRQHGQQSGAPDPMRGPRGGGTVTAVSGNTITVAAGGPNANGATSTVTVNSDTIYMLGGPDKATTGSLADVKTGSRVHAEGTTDSNGNVAAVLVRVEAPRAGGEVTAVSGNTITVQDKGPANQSGSTTTINVSSSTQYVKGGPDSTTAASLSDVVTGVRINAEGTQNSDGSFSATTVRIDQPPAASGNGQAPAAPDPAKGPRGDGTVTAVSGNTITVAAGGPNANGATSTVTVTSSTVYLVGGPGSVTKGSLSDVKVGTHLHADGANDGSGNVTAVLVRIDTPPTTTP